MGIRTVAVSDVVDKVVRDVIEALKRVGVRATYSKAINLLILIAASEVYSTVWDSTKEVAAKFIRKEEIELPDLRMEFQALLEECLNRSK